MSIQAQLAVLQELDERRRSSRRTLQLSVGGSTAAAPLAEALVHDISQSGLLIETPKALLIGERLKVDLPEIGPADAQVVWSSGNFFGCKFSDPIPRAAVSAALLLSSPPPAEERSPAPLHDSETAAEADDGVAFMRALLIALPIALAIWAVLIFAAFG